MKILIVDDNQEIRKILTETFTLLGCKIDAVKDGLEAVETLENSYYDIVITDGEMPRMKGIELTKYVKERYPRILVIGLSGSPLREKFKFAGADFYFDKPIDLSSLYAVIKAVRDTPSI